ncbi:MAG: hypothetical protein QXZ02_03710 [Candidatus Bathyarchaeia archaeon]
MDINALRNILPLIGISVIVACATFVVNIWLFSPHPRFSPAEASFIESLLYIIVGALLLLGSGGITRTSQRAAMLASAAKALGKEVIGPSEIFRRDAWKPKGFTRLGLILIMAGIILLILYFVLL